MLVKQLLKSLEHVKIETVNTFPIHYVIHVLTNCIYFLRSKSMNHTVQVRFQCHKCDAGVTSASTYLEDNPE